MFKYAKRLPYPLNIKRKDLKFAKALYSQYGGYSGELGAALRYFNQSFSMPDGRGQMLLKDIATEELGHVEMICEMLKMLTKGATKEELKEAGMEGFYAMHGVDLFPNDPEGVPFTTAYIAASGDPITNLYENMAAEEKARAVYENLIDLATDEDVINPLLFLRQREIVHFNRFKELLEYYQKILNEKNK